VTARFDLVVSGGGLAGSTLAALAARRGARVLVLERGSLPRDKVCGEFLSAEGCAVLARLGLAEGLRAAGGVPVSRWLVGTAGRRPLEGPLPRTGAGDGTGLGVSRSLLDGSVLDHARREGAIVLERHEGVEPRTEGSRVDGLLVRERGRRARTHTFLAPLVVAADGRRSALARRLHPELCDPRRGGARAWFGLAAHLALDPRLLEGRVELHLFDGGYAGLVGVEGGRLNLCALVRVSALRACGGRPERLLRERILANPLVRARVGDAPPVAGWRSVGPLRWGARRPAAAGVLFVGDAAGTIDPFSGDGMSHALRSAEMALPYALAAVQRGGLDPELGRAWTDAWNASFGGVRRRVRHLGRLFERPWLADLAIGLLGGPAAAWLPRLAASTR
jgi:flavin-dependent dehydrogenase